MGCASNSDIQVKEDKNVNQKNNPDSINKNKLDNNNNNQKLNECIEEKSEEEKTRSININNNNETNSKNKTKNFNNIISNYDRNYIINYKTNQSTNFKYLKNGLISSNQRNNYSTVFNQNKEKTNDKFIIIKHPLDNCFEDKEIEIHQIQSYVNEKQDEKKNNNNIEVNNSFEEKINNFNHEEKINNFNEDEDDMINMGGEVGDDDDMCNLGLSTEINPAKKKFEKEKKEINITFEIQATGQKIILKTDKNIKLIDLIELFRKKMKLSSFERPEFVFNGVYLIDSDKPISDYKIEDGNKINVFI